MRNAIKFTTAALAVGALTLGLSACGSSDSDSASASDTGGPLVVGASTVPHAEILTYIKENLAQKAGLDLHVKEFTDYVTLNPATEDGSVDANYFQNQPYSTSSTRRTAPTSCRSSRCTWSRSASTRRS